jgi:hypothetical protein
MGTLASEKVTIMGNEYTLVQNWGGMELFEGLQGASWNSIVKMSDEGEVAIDESIMSAKTTMNLLTSALLEKHSNLAKKSQVRKMLIEDGRGLIAVVNDITPVLMRLLMSFAGAGIDPDAVEAAAEDQKQGEEEGFGDAELTPGDLPQ